MSFDSRPFGRWKGLQTPQIDVLPQSGLISVCSVNPIDSGIKEPSKFLGLALSLERASLSMETSARRCLYWNIKLIVARVLQLHAPGHELITSWGSGRNCTLQYSTAPRAALCPPLKPPAVSTTVRQRQWQLALNWFGGVHQAAQGADGAPVVPRTLAVVGVGSGASTHLGLRDPQPAEEVVWSGWLRWCGVPTPLPSSLPRLLLFHNWQ